MTITPEQRRLYTEAAAPAPWASPESAPILQFATCHPLTGEGLHLKHSAERLPAVRPPASPTARTASSPSTSRAVRRAQR